MLSRLLIRTMLLAASLLAVATSHAEIIQEGGVAISPGFIDVGLATQAGGDGLLVVTSPSILTAHYMYVGTPQSFPTGVSRVRVEGGRVNLNELLQVGRGGHAVIDIAGGGQVDAATVRIAGETLAVPIATQGTATVHGTGSVLRYSNSLTVGNYGDGVLNITAGGAVIQTAQGNQQAIIGRLRGSTGRVVVDGPGSLWQHNGEIVVAGECPGELQITGGGAVISNAGRIGGDFSSPGRVRIDGPGSRWSVNSLQLGVNFPIGAGEILVTDGGVLQTGRLAQGAPTIGFGSFGQIVVNGPQSRWLVGNYAPIIGRNQGTGELHLENGTLFTSSGADMNQGSSARVVVSGPGTRWHSTGLIRLGKGNSQGVIEVRDGATIQLSLSAGLQIGASGRIVLDGGRIIGGLGRGNPIVAGIIEGDGRVEASQLFTTNTSRILVGGSDRLEFTGSLEQLGLIEIDGGELVLRTLFNLEAGVVRAESSTLRATGPEVMFSNSGSMRFVAGRNRVFGRVNNHGTVVVAPGAEVTFYDQVNNTGTMSASGGAQIIMLGTLIARGVAGDGKVALEGIVQPAGPSIAGNVSLPIL